MAQSERRSGSGSGGFSALARSSARLRARDAPASAKSARIPLVIAQLDSDLAFGGRAKKPKSDAAVILFDPIARASPLALANRRQGRSRTVSEPCARSRAASTWDRASERAYRQGFSPGPGGCGCWRDASFLYIHSGPCTSSLPHAMVATRGSSVRSSCTHLTSSPRTLSPADTYFEQEKPAALKLHPPSRLAISNKKQCPPSSSRCCSQISQKIKGNRGIATPFSVKTANACSGEKAFTPS